MPTATLLGAFLSSLVLWCAQSDRWHGTDCQTRFALAWCRSRIIMVAFQGRLRGPSRQVIQKQLHSPLVGFPPMLLDGREKQRSFAAVACLALRYYGPAYAVLMYRRFSKGLPPLGLIQGL